MTRLSKKKKGRGHDNLDRPLNILDFYIFIISTFAENCLSKMSPGCWILSGSVYLKRCIAGTEFFIFSREFFDMLHESFRGCKVLFLLSLESRCQVWNFTSKTKHVFVNFSVGNLDFSVKGQRTSSTRLYERQDCPSHSCSSLWSVSWNPVLIWRWLAEDPVSPQRKWMKLSMSRIQEKYGYCWF